MDKILDRFYLFLPSLLIVGFIGVLSVIYIRIIAVRWLGKDNLNSLEWHKNNSWKCSLVLGFPMLYIVGPLIEELIFRAPLIIYFDSISSLAWLGTIVSAIIFAVIHSTKLTTAIEVLQRRDLELTSSDKFTEEVEIVDRGRSKKEKIRLKIFKILGVLPLGLLSGYVGIKCQSLWASVLVHALWNILMPVIAVLLVVIAMSFLALFYLLRDKLILRKSF